MAADLTTELNGLTLKNPIISASGTYGYNNEFDVFCDVKTLGAVVTKAITLEPRGGNDWDRVIEVYGGMINSIGLENVGINKFIEEKLPVLIDNNIEFFMNVAGSTMQEYVELAKICERAKIKAIELNISCPNVKSGCLEFGTDEKVLYELVNAVRSEFSGFIMTKLTPNVISVEKIAQSAQKAGSNAISAINTLKGLGLKLNYVDGKFQKRVVQGGFSGRAIKPVALGVVNRISKVVDIPVIGLGGIYCLEDVLEFFAVGAEAVQLGTANFTHPDICETIVYELKTFMQTHNIPTIKDLKQKLREEN